MAEQPEQPERPERTAHEPPERLTFAQAAERLNISPDAVRMRAKRGTLATVRANDRPFVLWPQPERAHEPRTERDRSVPFEDTRLVAALEAHIASLERQLEERTEEIRRRDHIIAGFIERLPELPAGDFLANSANTSGNAPQDANAAPQRGDVAETTQEPVRPASDRLALGWRRWWRRATGG
jgi:hypothetical protein